MHRNLISFMTRFSNRIGKSSCSKTTSTDLLLQLLKLATASAASAAATDAADE